MKTAWKLIEIFHILWLGNIEVEARVDHVALAMLPTGMGINPAVGAEVSWDNEEPLVPAVGWLKPGQFSKRSLGPPRCSSTSSQRGQ